MRASKTAIKILLLIAFGAPLGTRVASAQTEETTPSETGTEATASTSDADASAEAKGTSAEVEEGTEKKKLSDRIKSVQRKVFLKKNRLEVFPYFGTDLNDPFFQHFIVGGSVGYHIVDSLSIEARGGVAVGKVRQSAIRFVRTEASALLKNPPEFKYHADVDFAWAPIYGKISLFGEGILHFDTYLTAGPGIFGTDAGVNPAVNVGLGQRYFITDWLVARLEIRDYLFLDNRNDESDLQNQLIFGFSLSGFFPTAFDYEF